MRNWTNDEVIQQWGTVPREVLESMEPVGDWAKRHLLNPVLLRMLGDVRGRRILDAGCGHEYEIPGPYGPDFHRPLWAYLNELALLDCQLREIAEPALDPATAASGAPGAQAYVHLPNFLVVAARRQRSPR